MRTPHALAFFLLLLALARAEEEYDYRLQINSTQLSGHLDATQNNGLAIYDQDGFWVILTPSRITYVDNSNPATLCGPSFTLVSGASEFSLDMKGFRIENSIPHSVNITVSPTNTGNCGGLYNMQWDNCYYPYHPLGFSCSHSLNTSSNTVEFTTSEGVAKLVNLASYISTLEFNGIGVFDFQTVPKSVNPGSNVGAIVGGTVGGICGVALIVGGVYYYKKKHVATQDGYSSYQEPFAGTSTYAPPL